MVVNGRVTADIVERAKKIKVVLMDVDGVMTSGMIVYDSNGLEIKHFNAHDGLGIKMAKNAGLQTGIISARESGTIRKRAGEIEMDHLWLGTFKKLAAFHELQKKVELDASSFCFIGDDLPDMPVLQEVGFAVAVQNAAQRVKEAAHYVTTVPGGSGAVREVIEIILDAQGLTEKAIERIWTK